MAESALQRAVSTWSRAMPPAMTSAPCAATSDAAAELARECAKARGCGVEVEALTFLASILRVHGENADIEQSTTYLRVRNAAVIGLAFFPASHVLALLAERLAPPPPALRLVDRNTVRDP